MPISIKDKETEQLARTLAAETGESITKTVKAALKERLDRIHARHRGRSLADDLDEIARRCAGLSDADSRTQDEILGYDEHGLPR